MGVLSDDYGDNDNDVDQDVATRVETLACKKTQGRTIAFPLFADHCVNELEAR